MKKLVIIGAGGLGREVAWLVERINQVTPTWELLGFLDDNEELLGTLNYGYPVLGKCEWLKEYPEVHVVCSIGASKIRKSIIDKLADYKLVRYATLIDPSVLYSASNEIGQGSIICANTVITVNVNIGQQVIINSACTIGHEAELQDYVTLYPSVNVSGACVIQEEVELGTGSQIIQGLTIGRQSIIGAGAVVVKNIPAKCTAVGSPAKPIKYFE